MSSHASIGRWISGCCSRYPETAGSSTSTFPRFEFQFIGHDGNWWGETQMLATQFTRQEDGS